MRKSLDSRCGVKTLSSPDVRMLPNLRLLKSVGGWDAPPGRATPAASDYPHVRRCQPAAPRFLLKSRFLL